MSAIAGGRARVSGTGGHGRRAVSSRWRSSPGVSRGVGALAVVHVEVVLVVVALGIAFGVVVRSPELRLLAAGFVGGSTAGNSRIRVHDRFGEVAEDVRRVVVADDLIRARDVLPGRAALRDDTAPEAADRERQVLVVVVDEHELRDEAQGRRRSILELLDEPR